MHQQEISLLRICQILVQNVHWFATSTDGRREEKSFKFEHIFPWEKKTASKAKLNLKQLWRDDWK